MQRATVLTSGLILASVAVFAQPAPSGLQTDFDHLVATERAFAKLSESQGVKASFLANVADDAVIFRPGAVPAKEWLSSHPNPQILLVWHPVYAAIARSGDLGWTTGPYELSTKGPEKSFGQFATVWRKQENGTWKLVVDLGVATPAAAPETGEPKLAAMAGGVPKDTATARESLLAADRELGKAVATQGLPAAYGAAVADTPYLLRDSHQPFRGGEAIRGFLATDAGGVSWEPQGSGVSAAGDLGYVYGTAARKDPRQAGVYLRVWQRPPGGVWKVVLDVVKLEMVR